VSFQPAVGCIWTQVTSLLLLLRRNQPPGTVIGVEYIQNCVGTLAMAPLRRLAHLEDTIYLVEEFAECKS
jgi:hypothetical protein